MVIVASQICVHLQQSGLFLVSSYITFKGNHFTLLFYCASSRTSTCTEEHVLIALVALVTFPPEDPHVNIMLNIKKTSTSSYLPHFHCSSLSYFTSTLLTPSPNKPATM